MTTTPEPDPERRDQPYPPPYPQSPVPMSRNEAQLWVLGAHLGPLVLGFIAPLVVMLAADRRSAYVRHQAVEALNFQLSFLIYFVVSGFMILLLIGIPLMIAAGVLWVVFMIVAAVRTSGGGDYRYPLTIRFVS